MNKKHALIMIACCLVPLVGFVLVSVFNLPLKSVLLFAMVLLCPLSHLLMMKTMMNDEGHQHGGMDHAHDHHAIPHEMQQISKQGKASE